LTESRSIENARRCRSVLFVRPVIRHFKATCPMLFDKQPDPSNGALGIGRTRSATPR
jgi:hypothetical protein